MKFNKLSHDMLSENGSEDLNDVIDSLIIQARELRYYDMEAVLFVRQGMVLNDRNLIEKGLNILKVLELNKLLSSVYEEKETYMSKINKLDSERL